MPPLSPRSLSDGGTSSCAAVTPPSRHHNRGRRIDDDDRVFTNQSMPGNVLLWKERQHKQLCRLGEVLSGSSRASE